MADIEKVKSELVKLKTEIKKIDRKKDTEKYRGKLKKIKRLQRKIRTITGKKLEAIRKKKSSAEEGKPKPQQQVSAK